MNGTDPSEPTTEERLAELEQRVAALAALQAPPHEGRLQQVHDYAWDWFHYHAQQRTSVFNFFLAAAALLFAGLGSAANEGNRTLTCIIAVLGILVSLCFLLIDMRNQELVDYGRKVLKRTETALFEGLGEHLGVRGIVNQDTDLTWFVSIFHGRHRAHFRIIEFFVCLAFVAALFFNEELVKEEKPELDAAAFKDAIRPVSKSLSSIEATLNTVPANLNALTHEMSRQRDQPAAATAPDTTNRSGSKTQPLKRSAAR